MTNEIKRPGDGKEFERDLDALARAYRDSAPDEPPTALDDAIRAAARRAVNARPQSLRKSWYSRFSGQLAIAAVMVLTVSITMVLVNEQPELAPPPVQKALAPRATAPTAQEETRMAEPYPAPALEKRRNDAPKLSQGRLASDALQRVAPAAPSIVQQAPETPAPAAAGSIAVRREPMPFAADSATQSEAKREAAAPPAKDLADLPSAQMAPRITAPIPAPAAARPAAPAMTSAAPAPMPAPAAARPAPSAIEGGATAKSMMAAPAASANLNAPAEAERSRSGATAAQAPAFARKKQDAANVQEMAEKPADALAQSPDQWLKRIVELRKEGKTKEAEEELAKFRKRYPDYPLPAELKSDR
jgi:resuscitation-promoting factor RpfA